MYLAKVINDLPEKFARALCRSTLAMDLLFCVLVYVGFWHVGTTITTFVNTMSPSITPYTAASNTNYFMKDPSNSYIMDSQYCGCYPCNHVCRESALSTFGLARNAQTPTRAPRVASSIVSSGRASIPPSYPNTLHICPSYLQGKTDLTYSYLPRNL